MRLFLVTAPPIFKKIKKLSFLLKKHIFSWFLVQDIDKVLYLPKKFVTYERYKCVSLARGSRLLTVCE
jgi:hypothetical protein